MVAVPGSEEERTYYDPNGGFFGALTAFGIPDQRGTNVYKALRQYHWEALYSIDNFIAYLGEAFIERPPLTIGPDTETFLP